MEEGVLQATENTQSGTANGFNLHRRSPFLLLSTGDCSVSTKLFLRPNRRIDFLDSADSRWELASQCTLHTPNQHTFIKHWPRTYSTYITKRKSMSSSKLNEPRYLIVSVCLRVPTFSRMTCSIGSTTLPSLTPSSRRTYFLSVLGASVATYVLTTCRESRGAQESGKDHPAQHPTLHYGTNKHTHKKE